MNARFAAALCGWLGIASAFAQAELPALRYQPDATVTWESGMKGLQALNLRTDEATMDRYPYTHTFSARRPEFRVQGSSQSP